MFVRLLEQMIGLGLRVRDCPPCGLVRLGCGLCRPRLRVLDRLRALGEQLVASLAGLVERALGVRAGRVDDLLSGRADRLPRVVRIMRGLVAFLSQGADLLLTLADLGLQDGLAVPTDRDLSRQLADTTARPRSRACWR